MNSNRPSCGEYVKMEVPVTKVSALLYFASRSSVSHDFSDSTKPYTCHSPSFFSNCGDDDVADQARDVMYDLVLLFTPCSLV